MRKIACNPLDVEQIYPKIDTGIRLQSPNKCTKFSQIKARKLAIASNFREVCDKTEDIFFNRNLLTHISEKA